MTVAWSPRAIGHLAALRDYCARENPGAAARTATTLLAAVDRLAELPNLGRPGRVSGTRELVVPGTRYVIPYRVRGERLEIIAVSMAASAGQSAAKRSDTAQTKTSTSRA